MDTGKGPLNLRQLVDKMLDDPEFYKKLKADPKSALAGQNVSEEHIEALKNLDYDSLEKVAQLFGPEKMVT